MQKAFILTLFFKGRKDAGAYQINQFPNGPVQLTILCCLCVSSRPPVLALEDFFQEEEDHLSLSHPNIYKQSYTSYTPLRTILTLVTLNVMLVGYILYILYSSACSDYT
ncbi:hypothetical protein QQ045_021265 [Rhodiola kirilowii]